MDESVQGVYIERKFTDEQTAKLEAMSGPSGHIANFLTDSEFELLRSMVLDPNMVYPEVGKVSKYWGFGTPYKPADQINDWLIPKLETVFGKFNVDFYAFQEAIHPWRIHADIRWEESKLPYKFVLFPLDVEPVTGPVGINEWPDTYTVTFKQHDFKRSLPENGTKRLKPNTNQEAWPRPWDDPKIERLEPGYHIDKATWDKYFTHIPYEHAEGLTIDLINKWQPRAMMYHDQTALHCASNFHNEGIRTKRCFIVATYL